MDLPKVKCSVSNCVYYEEGNNCGADLIMVEVDKHAGKLFREEFAGETFDTGHKDEAMTSSATCCHTFRRKR